MATSRLQDYTARLLRSKYPYLKILENKRPDWFQYKDGSPMELDFYIPDFRVAIEVQGIQHFRFVEFFHEDKGSFERQKKIDIYKKERCKTLGIRLFDVESRHDADIYTSYIEDNLMHYKAIKLDNDDLIGYRHDMVKAILRNAFVYHNFGVAIDKFKELNSTMIKSGHATLSFNDLRDYKEAFFPNNKTLSEKKF